MEATELKKYLEINEAVKQEIRDLYINLSCWDGKQYPNIPEKDILIVDINSGNITIADKNVSYNYDYYYIPTFWLSENMDSLKESIIEFKEKREQKEREYMENKMKALEIEERKLLTKLKQKYETN